ncbi:MAG: S1/P1 nuclease, partial [Acidobacteria bacterium]|nr:S1/P1 nuclease [Acidobacteriota bacterium]
MMFRTLRRGIRLLVLGILLLPAGARAWGPTGHMVVAQIAYDQLQPATRAEVDRLITVLAEEEPKMEHFVPASNWMDELRRLGWRAFDYWHFTNPPYNPEGLASVPPSHRHDVVWAIGQAVATLRNPETPDPQKAWMLRILEHLVGDVHQPLHCVNRYTLERPGGDRGGNLFELQVPQDL